jgi:hypothetical protein
LHGEVTDLGEEFFFIGLVKGFCIAWMRAECLSALGNKAVHPSLNLSDGEILGSGEFGGGGFSFDDFDDRGGLAAGGPALDVF